MKKKFIKIIIIICLIIMAIFITNNYLNKNTNNKVDNKVENKKESKKDFKSEYEQFSFYKPDYQKRYDDYKKLHPSLSIQDIITQVNIGLDHSFYTQTQKTPYLNENYILVNKYLYLGEDYVPNNLEYISPIYSRNGMRLVNIAKESFEEMAKKALEDQIKIIAMSSYRDYNYQVNLYNRYVTSDGVEAADTYSARPGYSEHQTGLCVDVYDGVIDYTNFEQSKSFSWMQDNAYKYGFILRYPKGKENITGYQYESWHYRYVGTKIATYIHEHNITFDEYYIQKIENKIKAQN